MTKIAYVAPFTYIQNEQTPSWKILFHFDGSDFYRFQELTVCLGD